MTTLTTGQAIVKSLLAHGVDTMFGIPGAHMYDFNDALYEHKDDINFVVTRHNINLVTIIFNNQSYGNVRRDQTTAYDGRLIGADLTNPDFVKLAESFGAAGYRVANAVELRPVLERALKDDAPVIIEVTVETGSEVSPWSFINPEPPT